MKKTIVLLGATLLLNACVTTQDFNHLQNRVAQLQQKQQRTQQQMGQRLQKMEKKLQQTQEQTRQIISNSTSPVRSTQANLWSEIETLKRNLARLRGEQESLQRQLKRYEAASTNSTERLDSLAARLEDVEATTQQIESQLGLEVSASEAESSDRKGSQASTNGTQGPESLYDRALQAFRDREYEKASSLWSLFVENNKDHKLVPNAYFWMGESYYQLEDYPQAVLKYQKVIEEYPDSGKYPPALLKQGLSFYKLNKNKAGRILLQELIDKYPDRAEARRARNFLQGR